MFRKNGLGHLKLESENSNSGQELQSVFTTEVLLQNITSLQVDALASEDQLTSIKERNDYLEEKVSWLRNKADERSFKPSKVKPESNFSQSDSSLSSALIKVINAMESETSRRIGLSISKSKRARKDKTLITKSEYFDMEYVASQLKQLGLHVKDPVEFFVSFGAELELSPSEKFDAKSYLAMNPDVKNSGINPLLHYIKHGKAEGRVLI